MNALVKDKAARVLRQLASVAVEHAELARELGGGGAFEFELADFWRALTTAVESGTISPVQVAMAVRDPWTEKPSALTFLGNLSDRQQLGADCLICGATIADLHPGETAPGQPSAVIDGKQTFIHRNPAVCTKALKEKIEKEIPF